jgi:hypothetical protein
VRALPPGDCAQIEIALERAKSPAEKLPSGADRLQVLKIAEQEFERKCRGR